MSSEAAHTAHSRLRFALAALCCTVYTASLIALAIAAARDPLSPLVDAPFSALLVGVNFTVCLGGVALFGVWRRRRERDAKVEARQG